MGPATIQTENMETLQIFKLLKYRKYFLQQHKAESDVFSQKKAAFLISNHPTREGTQTQHDINSLTSFEATIFQSLLAGGISLFLSSHRS